MSLRSNLWHDSISQISLKPPVLVQSTASLRETVEAMRKARSGCALVCDDRLLAGIFTERDYIKRVLSRGADLQAPVSDFMTPQPATARPTDPIGSAIRTMYQGGYRHLPVVDQGDVPVGMLSVKHVVQYVVDHFPSAVYNLPPRPGQVQDKREGA